MQETTKVLSFTQIGAKSGGKLLIAHGLFGSARNWGAIAATLASTHEVIAVDMRNHGMSFHSDIMSYEAMADDLAEVIRSGDGPIDVLGHSMGGKAAMMLALRAPELVRRLVIGDIAPVGYSHSHAGFIDAMQAVDLSAVSRRSDADRALASAVPDRGVRTFLLQSLELREGRARWRLNLPVLGRAMADLIGFPATDGSFDGPTLFLGGASSDYISDVGKDAIARHFSRARIVMLKEAGHWLHADQPEAFSKTVSAFLNAPGGRETLG